MESPAALSTLRRWISDRKLRPTDVAKQLGVSKSLVSDWLLGRLVPGAFYRLKIERWTDGAVEALAWLSRKEKAELKATKAYRAPDEAAA